MRYKPSWIERHLLASMLLLLFAVCLAAAFWQATLILALLTAAGYGLYRYTLTYDHRYQASRARRQALAAHADYEHQLWLQGDPRGMFGQYQPPC